MKGKRNFLIGLILGVLVSWSIVFFSLPFIIKNFSFLLGFIACLILVSISLVLLLVWDKKSLLFGLYRKKSPMKDADKVNRIYGLIRILVFIFIVLGSLVSGFVIFKQNDLFNTQVQFHDKELKHQAELLESIRNGGLIHLMSNILDKIDNELKDNPNRILSDETIARVAALSYSFKPYRLLGRDSLSDEKLSPERGQLLLALSKMNIDSTTFGKIKFSSSFSRSDLGGANLRQADLSDIDLNNANLNGADLRDANLKNANLKDANLWGANLRNITMKRADMKRANLAWCDLTNADLHAANLDGVDLTSAKLKKADLSDVIMEWADLSSAFLNEANLSGAEMLGTKLRRANLTNANLSQAKLILVKLEDVNLTNANMDGVDMKKASFKEKDWFVKLNDWQVIGAKEIQEKFKIVVDETGTSKYRLINIED